MRAPAITFPETPERPVAINAELQYRLDFLRVLNRTMRDAEAVQAHLGGTTAWSKAAAWIHERLIKAARQSIEELGPLTSAAQNAALADFIESLGIR